MTWLLQGAIRESCVIFWESGWKSPMPFPGIREITLCMAGVSCEASLLCDLMHLEGARELASYEEDFYAGTPVITENSFGAGKAYYVGTRSSQEFYRMFMRERMEEKGISPVLEAPEGVEATERFKDGKGVMFVLNHNDEETVFVLNEARKDLLTGEQYEGGTVVTLEAKGVMLLEN